MSTNVSIVLRVRNADGTRSHYAAIANSNGRLKSHYGLVDNKPTHLPHGVYYLRYREDGQRKWKRVGTDPRHALTAKLQQEHYLKGFALGLAGMSEGFSRKEVASTTKIAQEDLGKRVPILPMIHSHCRQISLLRSEKTGASYQHCLKEFAEGCGKQYLDEISREDIQNYVILQLAKKMSPKTISNRLVIMKAFLRKHGFDGKIIQKSDMPRIPKKLPYVYSREQVRDLLNACGPEDRLIFETFLGAGLREQELSHLGWEDVNFETAMIDLHAKPDLNFQLKDAEERRIRLPAGLCSKLQARRKARPTDRLVFATDDGKPNGHFLRRLKNVAFASSLNCGKCINRAGVSCGERAVCGKWTLHSFRRTAATRWHENGVSVPTVQSLLGHADVETTMSYLGIQDYSAKEFQESIDRAFKDIAT